ncbi:hypothetical protein [Longispora albida]|uniref:hypothetical protein n=1 Tax=Longispora albida TaxID=203523 RepID=UPI0003667E9F|nr:hypothetical protein [Longispora albida]
MFASSHSFGFFDYFRVPYRLTSARPGSAFGRLWLAGDQGGPSLVWPVVDPVRGPAVREALPGRYAMERFPVFGHVTGDRVARRFLAGWGEGGWRKAELVTGAGGREVAAVWRDGAGNVFLPFDPAEVMHQYWSEGYKGIGQPALRRALRPALVRGYYGIRPLLPRAAQIAARRMFARFQQRPEFPAWPVETALHDFYDWLFRLVADFAGRPVPWLAPWPAGYSWAIVLTHDVETAGGCRDIELLRAPERAAGRPSGWNFVPLRYTVENDLLDRLRAEGCEIGVHGLRHDGRDLGSLRQLRKRLPAMRAYAQRWKATGFRAPATQRNWSWMPMLGFEHDMSYHDTAPYEPTPGGTCSYLPFFNGTMVELPITQPQDHTLFTILGHSDAQVWLTKATEIRKRGGMMLVLTHPDYAGDPRVAGGYRQLLDSAAGDTEAWWATPAQVSAWWRRRAQSGVALSRGGWRVSGPAAAEGRLLFAEPFAEPGVPAASAAGNTNTGGRGQHARPARR